MCGIFAWAGCDSPPHDFIEPTLTALAHRGPDDHGTFIAPSVVLLHTRLAVIDIAGGRQPLANEDGSVTVVFNGEIYNFQELRTDLEAKGHRFATNSDTEVLVHLYEEQGADFLPRLNGMFAFALWDAKRRRLLAARDRFGVKPLYITQVGDGVALASECKALFAAGAVRPRLAMTALDSYFTHRFVKGPETAFAGVMSLPPGQLLLWEDGQLRRDIFWDAWSVSSSPRMDADEAVAEYERLLRQAVRRQLVSDVPLGLFLSGGADSGLICAAMSQQDAPPRTFTIGFENQIDERGPAGRIAARTGAEHTAFSVTLADLGMLPRLQWHLDSPFGDAIILPTYALAREARRHVTVALTGEGADETLGGYIHQKALWRISRMPFARGLLGRLLGRTVREMPVAWLDTLFEYPASMGKDGRDRLGRLLAAGNDLDRYFAFVSLFTEEERARLYKPSMAKAARESRDRARTAAKLDQQEYDFFQRLVIAELTSWLPDNILFKVDKLSMACGLEGRFPYLDNDLAQFSLGLPRTLKLAQGRNKFVLRETAEKMLPGLISKGKNAFYFSVASMFPTVYRCWMDTILTRERVERTGLIQWDFVKALKQDGHFSLLREKQLTCLVCFLEWYDQFFS